MIMNIPGDRDCPVRNKCVRLFKDYTGDALQLKIAETIADEWLNMYNYKPFNIPKPKIAVAYVQMTAVEKKVFDKEHPDWADSEEMKSYAFKEAGALREMESNKEFLEQAIQYLEKDVYRADKIRRVLAGYPTSQVKLVEPTASWHD